MEHYTHIAANHIASRLTVVDHIVIFSDGCAGQYKGRGSVAELTLSRWPEMHGEECNRIFDGSSGGMKATAAEVLWERSVERHRFRYTAILSDGDAKTYKHLCERRRVEERRMHQPRPQMTWYCPVKTCVLWE